MEGKGVLRVRGLHLEAQATHMGWGHGGVGSGLSVRSTLLGRMCGGCGEGDYTDWWGQGISGQA